MPYLALEALPRTSLSVGGPPGYSGGGAVFTETWLRSWDKEKNFPALFPFVLLRIWFPLLPLPLSFSLSLSPVFVCVRARVHVRVRVYVLNNI